MKTKPTFSFGGGKEMAGKNTVACFKLAQEIQDAYDALSGNAFSDEAKAKFVSGLRQKAKQIKLAVVAPPWFAELFR